MIKTMLLMGGLVIGLTMASLAKETPVTLQERIDKAQPGDVVEVPGGVYFERLTFPRNGEPEKPITLRAVVGQVAIINAGKRLDARLSPAAGLPEVFKGTIARGMAPEQLGIWEIASKLRMKQVFYPWECAQRLASWCYVPESGEIFVRSSGRLPAGEMEYWIEGEAPAIHVARSFIHVEGLQATLGRHGVLVDNKTRGVTVKGCRLYCNGSAGIHVTGEGHLIANNEAFRNNQHGIQLRYGVQHTKITGNLCSMNGPANGETTDTSEPTDLGIYSQGAYNLFEGNVASGFSKNAYRSKYSVNPTNVFRGNVVEGNANPAGDAVYGNTFIVEGPGPRAGMYINGGNAVSGTWETADPTGIQRASNLIYPALEKKDPRFCDPAYHDYRLQADTPCPGRGAHPGFAPVFYVDPAQGRAENSGLSAKTPFASLNSALAVAPAGATIYLLPGTYREAITFTTGESDGEPFRIRAWQRSEKVMVEAAWTISGPRGVKLGYDVSPGASGVEIEGLHFKGVLLAVENAARVRIRGCTFEKAGAGISLMNSESIVLDRNSYLGNTIAIRAEKSRGVSITESLFSQNGKILDSDAAESVYADFNSYDSLSARLGGNECDWAQWQAQTGNDRWSRLSKPAITPSAPGPDFRLPGARNEEAVTGMEVRNLRVAGLHPQGASLLWETPGKSTFAEVTLRVLPSGQPIRVDPVLRFQIMGEFFDMSFLTESFFTIERNTALAHLSPGTWYEVSITPFDLAGKRGEPASLTFTTPEKPQPSSTFYMRPEGDNAADGKTPKTAWRTFHHALERLSPGDTLLLMDGEYRETLKPRISGIEGAPITIRAENTGKAVIDLVQSLRVGVEILNSNHIQIEGLTLKGGKYSRGFNFLVSNAAGIRIARCELDYPARSSFQALKAGHNGLVADHAPGLVLEDNLFLCSIIHVGISASPGTLLRHNTIVGEGNYGIVIVPGGPEESYRVEGNLFYQSITASKENAVLRIFGVKPRIYSDHNLFYTPEGYKAATGEVPGAGRFVTLPEWQQATKLDLHSVVGKPLFTDPERRDFSLKAGSPGKNAAPGGDIGMRINR